MNPAWLPNVIIVSPNRMIIQAYPYDCFCFDPTNQKLIWTLENKYPNSKIINIWELDNHKFKAYFSNGVEHEVSTGTGKILDDGLLVK